MLTLQIPLQILYACANLKQKKSDRNVQAEVGERNIFEIHYKTLRFGLFTKMGL